ncbi:MAG: tRNA adenosine(34) deaminase TadA [Erysipelotrichaceae bacterium]|nr:tRNA adenosine(34) deaminase TadA [Erysipelotrichaceae bacterium]
MTREEKYMKMAIREAQKAALRQEVPVGAIIVYQDKVIARSGNIRIKNEKTASHCEMAVIEKANKKLGSWRLDDCELYVTLEPCPMCAGTILQARIRNVCFGAYDKKAGALGSVFNLFSVEGLNHYPEIHGGILQEECSEMLTEFFRQLRQNRK